MYRLTTKSGRAYEIDTKRGFWRRLRRPGDYDWEGSGWERLWVLSAMDTEVREDGERVFVSEDRMPEVGEMLHIASRDLWYRSTRIVSIEEVPDELAD